MTTLDGVAPPIPGETSASAGAGASPAALRRGGATYAFSQFGGMALGFLGTMVLARITGKDELASYFLLLQAILAIGLIMQLGLGPAALRFAPISRGEGGEAATALLRRRLFRIQISLWAVFLPPLFLAWPWIARRLDAPELAKAAPFLVGAAVLSSLGHLMDNYLRAFRRYTSSALIYHLMPRLLLLGGFLALWAISRHSVPWEILASIYLASQLTTALFYTGVLAGTTRDETSEPRRARRPPDVRTLLGATTAMGLRSAASVLFVSSDLWILAWARPHEEVAIYGIASRILQVMAALPGIAGLLIPQELSILYADGRRDEMERLARSVSTTVAMLSAACLLGIALLGRPLLHLTFGPGYLASWSILLILAVGTFWDTAAGSAGFVLQMSGHHNRLLLLTAGAAVLNVALSAALARIWGGHGVALATTFTLIVINLAMVESARRLTGVRTFVYLQPARWREALLRMMGRGGSLGGEA